MAGSRRLGVAGSPHSTQGLLPSYNPAPSMQAGDKTQNNELKATMQKNQQISLLALMLLGLALYQFAHGKLWDWIAHDLRGGDWASALAGNIAGMSPSPLMGIEGRLLWAASLILLVSSMGLLLAAGAYALIRRLPQRRVAAGIVLGVGLSVLVAGLVAATTADYRQFMGLAEGGSDTPSFNFTRHLLLIFQPYYQAATLDLLSHAEQLIPALVYLCNLLLMLALLATVWVRRPADLTSAELATRIDCYRLLLLLASALFTTIAFYHMSQYNWFAQVLEATNGEGAEQVRGLQRGITLYFGVINSLALALFFFPTGWLLTRQAEAIGEREPVLATVEAQSDWLKRHRLTIFSGPMMQLGAVSAPLVVSGGMTLLQQALNGG